MIRSARLFHARHNVRRPAGRAGGVDGIGIRPRRRMDGRGSWRRPSCAVRDGPRPANARPAPVCHHVEDRLCKPDNLHPPLGLRPDRRLGRRLQQHRCIGNRDPRLREPRHPHGFGLRRPQSHPAGGQPRRGQARVGGPVGRHVLDHHGVCLPRSSQHGIRCNRHP